MRVAAIGPGTPLALKVEAARIYPLSVSMDGRTRVHDEQDVELTLIEGNWFSLSIPEQRSSGYRWHLVSGARNEAEVVMMDDRFATPHNKPDSIGSRTMTFKVNMGASALQTFSLELRRPWQVGVPAAARKDIRIEVLPEPAVRIMR